MRAGVWWGAAAITLLAVTSALRTTQVEDEPRRGRRLQITPTSEANPVSVSQPEERPSFRPRSSRRFEEDVTKEAPRTRTRNRPTQRKETSTVTEIPSRSAPLNEKNERYDPRRSRTRSRTTASADTVNISSTPKPEGGRSRSRQFNRRVTASQNSQTTAAPLLSSSTIDESKIEVVNANLDEISKISSKTDDGSLTFKRRSSNVESEEMVPTRRKVVRLNARNNARSFDVDTGVNSMLVNKESTTHKPNNLEDLRASRKLRYRTRLSETDTNLTGEGLKTLNDIKSSQTEENALSSQPEPPTTIPVIIDNVIQESTESSQLSSTTKKFPIVRRPLSRNRLDYKPKSKPKTKTADEINEDDNYPESFKALIQAKNASTQTSSPNSENLSVKASQTVNKINSPSAQSTNTVSNKTDRYRNSEDEPLKSVDDKDNSHTPLETVKQKKFEYKRRAAFTPRPRKPSLVTSTTAASPVSSPSSRPTYKYNRKFKVSTTESTKTEINNDKKEEPNNTPRRSLPRPSYYARRRGNKNVTDHLQAKETTKQEIVKTVTETPIKRTSSARSFHYPRLRGKTTPESTTSTTELPQIETTQGSAERKSEDTGDMPLIFTLLKSPKDVKDESTELQHMSTENEENKEMFIIAVSSKESLEKESENEVTSKSDENNSVNPDSFLPSNKFHASYKEPSTTVAEEIITVTPTTPTIRNLQTRKYARQRPRANDYIEEQNNDFPSPKHREKKLRKYNEAQPARNSETPVNVITPESERTRSRFSSKYRAAYLDKPNYRPTVPTVTPTNAWLKFFVTDRQLIKSVEEPNWFGEDYFDVTTEPMPRPNISSHLFIYEPSIELVEVEEIDVGPDMNAIGITKTRKTLSSADLKLSESFMNPSQVMNVEASHHSPSVTVSIFDALADILTSTPKPRISSTTTAAPQTTTQNNDVNLTQVGVSNINNVNNNDDANETLMSTTTDPNTNNKFVQNTDRTTPNVINSLSVGEGVTLSTVSEDVNPETSQTTSTPILVLTSTPVPNDPVLVSSIPITSTSAPILTTSFPISTTSISARKPFAIKILYSNTESSTDKSTTAPEFTSSHPSTDNPKMVYNTVSDLILSNNNLLSSDLTSMLSNNIRDILHNMDENTRSKVSVDMAKLLKALVPRALGEVESEDEELTRNTTPYSLEDIKDTENVDFNISNKQNNDVNQIILTETVNMGENKNPSSLAVNTSPTPVTVFNDYAFTTSSLRPSIKIETDRTTVELPDTERTTSSPIIDSITLTTSDDFTVETEEKTNNGTENVDFNNNPSFTLNESQSNENINIKSRIQSLSTANPTIFSSASSQVDFVNNIDLSQVNSVSPLQYWVLTRKAKVLKMIEDLIQQHNAEIATAPTFSELLNQPNNIPMSQRLTEIINTMTTTNTPDLSLNSLNPDPSIPFPLSNEITSTLSASTGIILETLRPILEVTSKPVEVSLRSGKNLELVEDIKDSDSTSTPISITETTTVPGDSPEDNKFITTTTEIIDTTLLSVTTESNTELDPGPTTTLENIITSPKNELSNSTDQQNANSVENSFVIQSSPPKRDYVIFGILPNNTVVRKDPNDDALETLTEASPYIVYGVLPNNTIIRKFPNGTRVPRVRQKIDILPISPWSLKNPYSPIHNNPAIVKPQFNLIRVPINNNNETSNDIIKNDTERLTNDTVNNLQEMISSPVLNIKDSSSLGVTSVAIKPPSEKSTASHVLSLRTSTMLPSIDEILLNSISSAAKEEMVISSMTSSTREPRILTLDIDPETKQIRTEKPEAENGKAVFKFIPIDEVTTAPQISNVLKLATKIPTINTEKTETQSTVTSPTSTVPPTTQTQPSDEMKSTIPLFESTTVPPIYVPEFTTKDQTTINLDIVTSESNTKANDEPTTNKIFSFSTTPSIITTTETPTTPLAIKTTEMLTTTAATTTVAFTTTVTVPTLPTTVRTTTEFPSVFTTDAPTTKTFTTPSDIENDLKKYQEDAKLLETLLQAGERNPKNLNIFSNINTLSTNNENTTVKPTNPSIPKKNDEAKLLQALLSTTGQNQNVLTIPNIGGNLKINSGQRPGTTPSIEDDIRQFEEDTKLLKALLQATGQNPASFNIPLLENIKPVTTKPRTTTAIPLTTRLPTTINTTPSIADDLAKFQEDAKLLEALLQATGQNVNVNNKPSIQGVTSKVRISSNPMTTFIGSNPTTQMTLQPVFKATPTTAIPTTTKAPVTTTTETSTADSFRISTTFAPVTQKRRWQTTTSKNWDSTTSLVGRRVPIPGYTVTTEQPSTSTFSVQEDIEFLNNLKSVLQTNTNEDQESNLANRIIALAVEKSLNEIQTGVRPESTTTTSTTTTTTTPRTTTTFRTTTVKEMSPSIEDDIKQFEKDTQLLQALLKATGQDPSKFNIPKLPEVIGKNPVGNTKTQANPSVQPDLKVLTNLLNVPSPLNEPFDSLTKKSTVTTTPRPYGAKIVAPSSNNLPQNDDKPFNILDVQETTTQRGKLAITGQSSDEALKNLINQKNQKGMVSEATQSPLSLSTEYGNSNDALLAALLKEQGFGPTTASSLDEQLKLAALLNHVVVTPKSRRTTTLPPPPPPPRRPILDGLTWLWQQWRETAPGPGASRPNRKPAPSPSSSYSSSTATSNRVNWFGSGPFVGNADDRPANRIPLEPPRAVAPDSAGRGQLVSAAINVTRAFSQFLGAAIQGAAQTVQNVIRAGQRAASDVYTNGSGGSR